MRSSLIILTTAIGLGLASPALAQSADHAINPQSVALASKGDGFAKAGDTDAARDLYEAALAVDPRNKSAFVSMAEILMTEKLYGKAVRHSNKALAIDPKYRAALAVKGRALAAMGAGPKAEQLLSELNKLCGKAKCPEAAALTAAIARGADPAVKLATKKS